MIGFCRNPNAVLPNEKYLVCKSTEFGEEHIVQSESSADRAEHSVEVLNEHEKNNARTPNYYWRPRVSGEIINGKKTS